MRVLFGILGMIFLIPIIFTIAILTVITLIGGYVSVVVYFGWRIAVGVLIIVLLIALIKKLL